MGVRIRELGAFAAVAACLFLACCFVGVLYLVPSRIRKLPRNNPEHVIARFHGIVVVSVLSPLFVWLFTIDDPEAPSLLAWLGLTTSGLFTATFLPLFLTISLFIGPIVQDGIEFRDLCSQIQKMMQAGKPPQQTSISMIAFKRALQHTSTYANYKEHWSLAFRNYFFGPFTEEWVFRSCMLPLLLASGMTTTRAVFVAPLFFGVAHAHHFVENVRYGTPWQRAALITLVQLTYTSLFGMYAAFIYVRTGHLLSATLAHMFCNFMGLPDFGGVIQHSNRAAIVPAYIFGIATFYFALFPWSNPTLYGSIFFENP